MLKSRIIPTAFAFALLTSVCAGLVSSPAAAANHPDGAMTPDVSTRFCPDLGHSRSADQDGPNENVNAGTKSCAGIDHSGVDITN